MKDSHDGASFTGTVGEPITGTVQAVLPVDVNALIEHGLAAADTLERVRITLAKYENSVTHQTYAPLLSELRNIVQ